MSLFIVGNLLGQLRYEVWPFGTGADKRHFSAQNVPKLRDLINADLPDDPSDSRHPLVALAGPDRSVLFCVNSHRAKLCQHKRLSVFTNALLLIKDRPTRFQLDENRGNYHDGKRQNRADQSCGSMRGTAQECGGLRLAPAAGEDQPGGTNHVQGDASGEALVKRGGLFYLDAG